MARIAIFPRLYAPSHAGNSTGRPDHRRQLGKHYSRLAMRAGKAVHFPQHYDEVFFSHRIPIHPAGLQGQSIDQRCLCRNTFQMPVYRIANSNWLAGEFRRRFAETVPVVQHGIDANRFHLRPKLSSQDGVIRVVTYSRPEKWKGFQDAVPAMARAHAASSRQNRVARLWLRAPRFSVPRMN